MACSLLCDFTAWVGTILRTQNFLERLRCLDLGVVLLCVVSYYWRLSYFFPFVIRVEDGQDRLSGSVCGHLNVANLSDSVPRVSV